MPYCASPSYLGRTLIFGIALSHDSAHYISAARSLMSGKGLLGYDGDPYTFWPPFCPLALAGRFERRGSGVLVGVSSVAGDRGRAANYVYGSAKAGFTAYLSGLRNRLARSGVHVVTVKPGFVRIRMTGGMALPARLTATPEAVAAAVLRAIRQRRDVVYARRVWRPVMFVIRAVPERIFKRLNL